MSKLSHNWIAEKRDDHTFSERAGERFLIGLTQVGSYPQGCFASSVYYTIKTVFRQFVLVEIAFFKPKFDF
jgi:hypothetical protein